MKKTIRVLFASVIYESMKAYIYDFIKSIKSQTYAEFDILIGNDGFNDDEILREIKRVQNCEIKNFTDFKLNPSEIRIELIKYAYYKKYDLLIFGDSDDTFSENRIERIVEDYRADVAIYYNDLINMSSKTDFFKGMLPKEVDRIDMLDDYNFIGMSNSAINVKRLNLSDLNLEHLSKCIAFDWFLYGMLIRKGLRAKKVEDCKTYYRIYANNIAGDTSIFTKEKLCREIEVKKFQYNAMSKFDKKFEYKIKLLSELEMEMINNKFSDKYINKNSTNSVFWWGSLNI